ncbi:MAG: DUF3800 domain-containing protein [Rhodospirillaceae bacterium]|nr:DUF3800 domain-containing protein [Rhodospirillaceae bacterium]
MGESKRKLYAFVDETGNTGHNLFDEGQPDFFTAALVTKGDFDTRFGDSIASIARSIGTDSLHARKLGVGRLEKIAPSLLKVLIKANASFFVSRVEKRYLLATKLFDSLFDSGENAGVAWHHYNVRPLRLTLAFKMAFLVDEQTARLFWECVVGQKRNEIVRKLPTICDRLIENILRLPDKRSQEVLKEGLEWARDHPDSIQLNVDQEASRHTHFPNLVAFTNLLDGLDTFSKDRKTSVARITHDEQSEFERTLAACHKMFTNAPADEISWAGEKYSLQKVAGSTFEVKQDSNSAGIQISDVVLWLYSQFHKNRPLPEGCQSIIMYVMANGWENDFSFSGVERMLIQSYGKVFAEPLTPEQLTAAQDLLGKFEEAKTASMQQYERDQLPPFMRSTSSRSVE